MVPKQGTTNTWIKQKENEKDGRYHRVEAFRKERAQIQMDALARKTSRAHEIYRKTNKKPKTDKKKIIDQNNPMYRIIVTAQKRNEEYRKKSFKSNDPFYIDINNMTVADRVKIIKLAKKKNNPQYRQLLLEKNTTALSELARKRKTEMMQQEMEKWKKKKANINKQKK